MISSMTSAPGPDTGDSPPSSGGTSTVVTPPTDHTSTGAAATPPGDVGNVKTFTQADVDRILGEKLAGERRKFDQQLADAQAAVGKTELEAAQYKAEQAEARIGTVTKESGQRLASAEAKIAAHLAGARPDRLAAVLKQADLTAVVSDDGTVDDSKVKAAIGQVLADYPEWKAATSPAASGGELNPGGQQQPTFSRKQIAEESKALSSLPPAEAKAKVDAWNAAMSAGRVTG